MQHGYLLPFVFVGAAPALSTFAPGSKILDRYIVEEMIGIGGMGIVFRATHEILGETVAIKCLRTDNGSGDEMLARFLREARAAAQIKSQHVARVHDVGALPNGTPYMVMEYLAGQDLSALLERVGALPAHEAIEYTLQACHALVAAHKLGLVHRDIKPANFFLTSNEHDEKVIKMLDFGISKAEGENLTKSAVMLGTPFYMAPEQLYSAKAADARSDIWSMGVVLYELIEGTRPFDGNSVFELGGSILTNPPQPPHKAWPPGLFQLVETCLSKAPEQRFQSASELLEALLPFDANTTAERHVRSRRKKPDAAKPPVNIALAPAPPVPAAPRPPTRNTPVSAAKAAGMTAAGVARTVAATAVDATKFDTLNVEAEAIISPLSDGAPPQFETLVVKRGQFATESPVRKSPPYWLIGTGIAILVAVGIGAMLAGKNSRPEEDAAAATGPRDKPDQAPTTKSSPPTNATTAIVTPPPDVPPESIADAAAPPIAIEVLPSVKSPPKDKSNHNTKAGRQAQPKTKSIKPPPQTKDLLETRK